MKDKIEAISKCKIFIVGVILSVLGLVSYFLPFVKYTYKKVAYTVSGFDFVTGKTVAGGKVTIVTDMFIIVGIVACVVVLLLSLLYSKMNKKVAIGIMCIASILTIVGDIKLVSGLSTTFKSIKGVGVAYGNIISVIAGAVLLIVTLRVLKSMKVLSSLDFMILPGLLYFAINNYIPMFGISIAFKKVDYSVGIWNSPWCGFDNFKQLFAHTGSFFESDAFIITRNTLLYNIAFIIVGMITGVVVGICLADIFSKVLQKFFQTTILLPQLISMVIVAYIVYALFSNETGMINKMLGDENSVNFYATKKYWPFILIFVNTWKQIGYNAIIFLSSIVGIDRSLYEAGRVDGAGRWKTIKYITLPLLKPTVITLTMLQVGRIFYSDFGLFYQVPMNSGALYSVTNTIDTYVYRCLMVLNNISTSSAASTYQAVVGFVIVMAVNALIRKADKENAMF